MRYIHKNDFFPVAVYFQSAINADSFPARKERINDFFPAKFHASSLALLLSYFHAAGNDKELKRSVSLHATARVLRSITYKPLFVAIG
jgi:hypothetical protein